MSSGPDLLRPFDGPNRTALKTTWQQARAAAPGLWSDQVAFYGRPWTPTRPPQPKAHSPSTKPKKPMTTYSEAWTAAPRMDRLRRHGSAAWPAPATPCGSRHSQLPVASHSPTQSSVRRSADASDCPPCPAVPPPSPASAARPWPPQTRSTPTRAPPPMRFACCATMNWLK
jgi:hypothetical protein